MKKLWEVNGSELLKTCRALDAVGSKHENSTLTMSKATFDRIKSFCRTSSKKAIVDELEDFLEKSEDRLVLKEDILEPDITVKDFYRAIDERIAEQVDDNYFKKCGRYMIYDIVDGQMVVKDLVTYTEYSRLKRLDSNLKCFKLSDAPSLLKPRPEDIEGFSEINITPKKLYIRPYEYTNEFTPILGTEDGTEGDALKFLKEIKILSKEEIDGITVLHADYIGNDFDNLHRGIALYRLNTVIIYNNVIGESSAGRSKDFTLHHEIGHIKHGTIYYKGASRDVPEIYADIYAIVKTNEKFGDYLFHAPTLNSNSIFKFRGGNYNEDVLEYLTWDLAQIKFIAEEVYGLEPKDYEKSVKMLDMNYLNQHLKERKTDIIKYGIAKKFNYLKEIIILEPMDNTESHTIEQHRQESQKSQFTF